MSRQTQILAAALLVAIAVTVPFADAAKTKRVASEVEIAGMNYGTTGDFQNRVVGDVDAKKPKCERNREVSLYFTPAEDSRALTGTATTDRTGDWEVLEDGIFDDGTWDATVSRLKIKRPGKDIVCKPDESPPKVLYPPL